MLSEKEKKAIRVIKIRTERLLRELKIEEEDFIDEPKIAYLRQEIEANDTVLNLIEKQEKEIDKVKEICNIAIDDIGGIENINFKKDSLSYEFIRGGASLAQEILQELLEE